MESVVWSPATAAPHRRRARRARLGERPDNPVLVEVVWAERAPILKRSLTLGEPVAAFEKVASAYPALEDLRLFRTWRIEGSVDMHPTGVPTGHRGGGQHHCRSFGDGPDPGHEETLLGPEGRRLKTES